MSIESSLEKEIRLSDLMNEESLGNLCARFTELVGVSPVVTDLDGAVLQGTPGADIPFVNGSADKFASFAADGRQFLRARVDNQFDPLGYVLLGPIADGSDGTVGRQDGEKAIRLMCTVLEEIAFANFQSWMAAKMSLEAQHDQLGELVTKEAELHRFELTLEKSKDLRDLF